jgi:hypothetical protein
MDQSERKFKALVAAKRKHDLPVAWNGDIGWEVRPRGP